MWFGERSHRSISLLMILPFGKICGFFFLFFWVCVYVFQMFVSWFHNPHPIIVEILCCCCGKMKLRKRRGSRSSSSSSNLKTFCLETEKQVYIDWEERVPCITLWNSVIRMQTLRIMVLEAKWWSHINSIGTQKLESLDGFWNRFPWIRHGWGNLNVESPKMV